MPERKRPPRPIARPASRRAVARAAAPVPRDSLREAGGAAGHLVAPLAAAARIAPEPVGPEAVSLIFERLRAANPTPRAELEFINPYTLLVAVVLSAQATDRSVNLATRPLFAIADNPAAMLALGEARVREFIRTIGLFNTKAKNVIALSQRLIDAHGGAVPRDRAALEVLPGVGRKTASVVLNIAFEEPTIAVDTHIFRVSNRIPLVVARTPDKVQAGLERIVPERDRLDAHHWLILHGRYTCRARRPACPTCLVADLCRYPDKTPA